MSTFLIILYCIIGFIISQLLIIYRNRTYGSLDWDDIGFRYVIMTLMCIPCWPLFLIMIFGSNFLFFVLKYSFKPLYEFVNKL